MSVRRLVLGTLATLGVGAALLTLSQSATAGENVTLTGQLVGVHEDDFDHARSRHTFGLTTAEGARTQLRFTDEAQAHQLAGREVTIRGERRGDVVHVAYAQGSGGSSTTAAPAAASGEVNVAVVLLSFKDKPLVPGPTEIRDLMFPTASATPTVGMFFGENSYGKQATLGQVFPTVQIDALSGDACDFDAWGVQARQLAGVNEAAFSHVAHVMPSSTCEFGGVAYLPGKYSWTVTSGVDTDQGARSFRGIMAHELGHNFGAHHGGAYTCTDAAGFRTVLSNTCSLAEYGDPFTTMGAAWPNRHFNAFQKGSVSSQASSARRIPWLTNGNTLPLTSGSATLQPLEAPSTGVQVVRIPKPGSRTEYYYVEHRGGTGTFDKGDRTWTSADGTVHTNTAPSGLTIRIAPSYGTRYVSKLLDLNPGTAGFADAALAPGATFVDGALRIQNTTTAGSLVGSVHVTLTTSKGRK